MMTHAPISILRLFKYACLLAIVTLIFGAIYLALQQNYRLSANDPQIQLAEDTVILLNKGAVPQWKAANDIDAGQSLTPFIVIYSATGTPLAASGLLDGTFPTIPSGIFAYINSHGEDRFTWQPTSNLRFATVVMPYNNGYVLAARSLSEVEKREAMLNTEVGLPWLLSVLLVLIYGAFAFRYKKK
jgi:hypothetical protein